MTELKKMQTRCQCKCKWDTFSFICIAALLSIQVLRAQSRCSGVVGLCLRIQLVHIPIIEMLTVSVYMNREKRYRSRWPPHFMLGLLCVQLFEWECWSRNSFAFPEPALQEVRVSWTGPLWSSLKITATQELMSSRLPFPQLKEQMVIWERGYASNWLLPNFKDWYCGEQYNMPYFGESHKNLDVRIIFEPQIFKSCKLQYFYFAKRKSFFRSFFFSKIEISAILLIFIYCCNGI